MIHLTRRSFFFFFWQGNNFHLLKVNTTQAQEGLEYIEKENNKKQNTNKAKAQSNNKPKTPNQRNGGRRLQKKTAPSKHTADPAIRASKQDQKPTRSTRFTPPTVTELAGVNNHWKGPRKHGDEVVADTEGNCRWIKSGKRRERHCSKEAGTVTVIEDEGRSVRAMV
jgi:hypothetical protein